MSSTESWPHLSPTRPRRSRTLLRRAWLRLRLRERHWRMYWTAVVLFTLLVMACFVPLTHAADFTVAAHATSE